MAAQVKFTKYILSSSKGKKILDSDFSSPFSLEENSLVEQVAFDLSVFDPKGHSADFSSLLYINTGKEDVVVERNYSEGHIVYQGSKQSDPNFFWVPEELDSQLRDGKNPNVVRPIPVVVIKEELKKLLEPVPEERVKGASQSAIVQAPVVLTMEQQIEQVAGSEGTQLWEAGKKIKEIEDSLQRQREADDAMQDRGALLAELDEMEQRMKDVQGLMDQQAKVQTKLQQYNGLLGADLEQRSAQLKAELDQLRKQDLMHAAQLMKQHNVQLRTDWEQKKVGWMAKELLGLPVLLASISAVGYLTTQNLVTLLLGVLGIVGLLAMYVVLNRIAPDVQVAGANETELQIDGVANEKAPAPDVGRMGILERFFIDKAWVRALQLELEGIQRRVIGVLGGQQFQKVAQARDITKAQLEELEIKVNAHKDKEISPEDYLRMRRELDMQKIERSRLETRIRNKGSYEQLSQLFEQAEAEAASNQDPQSVTAKPPPQVPKVPAQYAFVAALSRGYSDIGLRQGEPVWRSNSTQAWTTEGVSDADWMAAYTYVKLAKWQEQPGLPMVIVDVSRYLSEVARSGIDARIEQAKQAGQVIRISLAA